VLRFLDRTVDEPDDRERWHAAREVGFHLDAPRLEADQRVRERTCEHVATRRQFEARLRRLRAGFALSRLGERSARRFRATPTEAIAREPERSRRIRTGRYGCPDPAGRARYSMVK